MTTTISALAALAPRLELTDPLAELLGAVPERGTFTYTYEDAVKLAGHSCPTVAGAYLLTCAALRALYADAVPVRGELEVTVGGARDAGGTGPMSQVITLLTGAAPETGFGGLGGHGRRKDLLTFDPALGGRVRFRRRDTGRAVLVTYDARSVPRPPELRRAMEATLSGQASAEQRRRFGELWQGVVRAILQAPLEDVVRVEAEG